MSPALEIRRRRMRRIILLVGVVAVVATVLAAGQAQAPFTVVAVLEEEQEEDLGEEGPSVGDLYAFSGPMYDDSEDTLLGRFDGVCTTTSSPGPSEEARRLCNTTATFAEEREGAEIDAQGVGRIEAEDVVFAVTGGNREFRAARGQATFEYEEREDRIEITYELES
jgi:hypothetical protein